MSKHLARPRYPSVDLAAPIQLKEAYEQMQTQPSASCSQGLSDESGTDNDSKVCANKFSQPLEDRPSYSLGYYTSAKLWIPPRCRLHQNAF